MSLYVDSSVLLKRYLEEPDSERFTEILASDPRWVTARIASVEVRRTLARALGSEDLVAARQSFWEDWGTMSIAEIDAATCDAAAEIAELTGLKTLDAVHLGAIKRIGPSSLPLVTADRRQAEAARSLGWTVLDH